MAPEEDMNSGGSRCKGGRENTNATLSITSVHRHLKSKR